MRCEAANSQLSTTLPSSLSVSPIEMNHKHHVHHGDVPFAFCALPAHSGERRAAVDEGSTYYSSKILSRSSFMVMVMLSAACGCRERI